ncbi:hypothetical protein C8Q77DRAFT_305791 [Trametes polyzona]|nr:hypothetical protein C8Q77DRAFT_305791 [Trametes polyzona]
MLATALAISALTLVGHARLIPISAEPTDIGASFPVHPIGPASPLPTQNNTHGRPGPHPNIVPSDFPATLLLCNTVNCISCFQFDLSTIPHNSCLQAGFSYLSMAINQPNNAGLDFGVFGGPAGCASFAQIPTVNECFNSGPNGQAFADFALA